MKIPVLRRLNWSVGGERLEWALCPSPESGVRTRAAGPESESKMEQAPHFRSLPTPRFPSDLSNIIDVR
jgi:hypothetical protein